MFTYPTRSFWDPSEINICESDLKNCKGIYKYEMILIMAASEPINYTPHIINLWGNRNSGYYSETVLWKTTTLPLLIKFGGSVVVKHADLEAESNEFKSQLCHQACELGPVFSLLWDLFCVHARTQRTTDSLWGSNDIMLVKCLIQCLAHSKYSINISFKKYQVFLEHWQCARPNLGNKMKRHLPVSKNSLVGKHTYK